jgi:gluconokinase
MDGLETMKKTSGEFGVSVHPPELTSPEYRCADRVRMSVASSIVVMGVSGSGKSTVGAALAQRLGVPFADADDFHPPANIAKMEAGIALDDDDRYPWLEAIGGWLADNCGTGGVMSCSALKRRYRDQLRRHCPQTEFVHLSGSPEVIAARQASRPGHFMPASLMASQFATLEPLQPDERGVTLDVSHDIDSIVESYLDQAPQRET